MTAGQWDYEAIEEAVSRTGLRPRGGFRCEPGDGVPGVSAGASLILVGSIGAAGFDVFLESPEYTDGVEHPLDRFSERVIDALAADLGARSLYPHRGPPWLPFQRWAVRAEGVQPSPLGVLIHPCHGLWHAYRGALVFPFSVSGIPGPGETPSPCSECPDRPCLGACPVGAFSSAGYDVTACGAYLATPAGNRCLTTGCQARLACPVAPHLRHEGEQAAFHMAAFARAHGAPGDREAG